MVMEGPAEGESVDARDLMAMQVLVYGTLTGRRHYIPDVCEPVLEHAELQVLVDIPIIRSLASCEPKLRLAYQKQLP